MVSIWRSSIIRNLVLALILIPAVGMAADFELLWDPNCSENDDLEGYIIHYIEGESVIYNQFDATQIYVSLSENGFDPDTPRYLVSGLIDDVTYCFAVSAFYEDEESGMSNETCGVNGVYVPSPGGGSSDGSTNNLSGGCFIGALK
jgi:hypothetical protein